MIIVNNDYKSANVTPKNMDIRQHVDIYFEGDDVVKLVEDNLSNHKYERVYGNMVKDCFYYPEDKSVNKVVAFIEKLQK